MEGIPLALDAERAPMLELLVIRNLECNLILRSDSDSAHQKPSEKYSLVPGSKKCRPVLLSENLLSKYN